MPWRWVSLQLTFDHKLLDLFRETQRQISCSREMNQRPLKNGRFLSPDSERQRKDKPQGMSGLCRVEDVSIHCHEDSASPAIVDHK